MCHWVGTFEEEIRCLTAHRWYLASCQAGVLLYSAGGSCSGNICPGPACALPRLPVCRGAVAPDSDSIFLKSCRKLNLARVTNPKRVQAACEKGRGRPAVGLDMLLSRLAAGHRCVCGSGCVKEALRAVQSVAVPCPAPAGRALCCRVL